MGAGDPVTVELYRDVSEIGRTIVHIGSHDLCLDLLASSSPSADAASPAPTPAAWAAFWLSAAATPIWPGSHLLDTATGKYNILQQYLPCFPWCW